MGDNLFWIVSFLLVVLAVLFVVVPVLRHRSEAMSNQRERERIHANLAIFQERLAELEADRAAGVTDEQQFQALKTELERSLLSDVDEASLTGLSANGAVDARSGGTYRLVPILIVLLVAPLSYVLYNQWGFRSDLEVAELFERSRAVEDPREIMGLIEELGDVAMRDPKNGWAWYFIARHLVTVGLMDDAAQMFQRAAQYIDHPQDKAVVLGQYAQTTYMAAGQQMTDEVQDIIRQAQRLNPNETTILQLLAADAFVNGDYQGAVTYWQQLLTLSPSAEEAAFLRSVIAEAQQMLLAGGAGEQEDVSQALVEVSLSISPEVDIPAGTRVFVSAQDTLQSGPPLAVKVLTIEDLPAVVTLSDADAVGPFVLSSAETVRIVATASIAGTADVQSGDYQVSSEEVQLDEGEMPVRLQLMIEDVIP